MQYYLSHCNDCQRIKSGSYRMLKIMRGDEYIFDVNRHTVNKREWCRNALGAVRGRGSEGAEGARGNDGKTRRRGVVSVSSWWSGTRDGSSVIIRSFTMAVIEGRTPLVPSLLVPCYPENRGEAVAMVSVAGNRFFSFHLASLSRGIMCI